MHAAALGGASMLDVQRWVADAGRLRGRGAAAPAQLAQESIRVDALQFVTTNNNTRTSITSTIMPALAWLNDEDAAEAAGQGPSRGRCWSTARSGSRSGPGSTSPNSSGRAARCTCSVPRTRRSRRWCAR